MKNIEVISEAHEHRELFAASDAEFALVFGDQNFALMSRVAERVGKVRLFSTMAAIFERPVTPGPGIRVDGVLLRDGMDVVELRDL